ncbi:MAG TPA: hypothetical protein VGB62_10070 [Allosphingosinicella sp.]
MAATIDSNDNHAHAAPLLFRLGEENSCPDCGASHWLVGRRVAECGACGSALPLAGVKLHGAGTLRGRKGWRTGRMPRAA